MDSDWVCSSHARRDRTTLLRFLSSSMIFASIRDRCRGRGRGRRDLDEGGGQEATQTDAEDGPPLTTSMTVPVTTPSSSLTFSIWPHARSYCAHFFDRRRRPSCLPSADEFDLVALLMTSG